MMSRGLKKGRADDENESEKGKERKENVVGEGGGALFTVDFEVNIRGLDNDAPCLAQRGAFFAAHSND